MAKKTPAPKKAAAKKPVLDEHPRYTPPTGLEIDPATNELVAKGKGRGIPTMRVNPKE